VILKKNFLQGYSEQQQKYLHEQKYPAPVFGWGKCCKTAWLQGST
jgi:hypothetical protein